MKSSNMYACLLSKKIPVFAFSSAACIFLFFIWGEGIFSFLINFIGVYIGIVIIIEIFFSYVRTFSLVKHVKDEKALKKVRFYLQVLPYVPAFFGSLVICLFKIWFEGNIYYRDVIYILAGTQLVNFISSIVVNTRIRISSFIDKPDELTYKKQEEKQDDEVKETN
ncbi:hypothetical protein K7I13_11500 [Brucepastera parasyntrophica]|uniref:hypothetical protein n=1 Tax=Brucepastera parasyntrophica TaxID=2880008 RepID=UPI00210EEEC9|nr:hypothetical protein [Brucepastera parasyntrophica]ULQ59122.1 hypothetical protein K7I13_11500 [Brucepastera parasyntrophica]